MDQQVILQKAEELNAILTKYKSDLGVLEKELLVAVGEYHEALKQEKLKEIKASISWPTLSR